MSVKRASLDFTKRWVFASPNSSEIVSRQISTGGYLHEKKKAYFDKRWMRQAGKPLPWKLYKEPILASNRRKTWEYPVSDTDKASWKHSRWFDQYSQRWIPFHPRAQGFDINYKRKREALFDAENLQQLFPLLLDNHNYKKYIIRPFNHQFSTTNMSYFYQHLTHTKYVHGLPYQVENATVSKEEIDNLERVVQDSLLYTSMHSDENDSLKKHEQKKQILTRIFQYLVSSQISENEFLENSIVDYDANNSMFWFRGRGFLKWTKSDDLPVAYQSHDSPLLQIRSDKQLSNFSNTAGNFSMSGEIPTFYTTPHVLGVPRDQYRNSISAGYRMFVGNQYVNYQTALNDERLGDLVPPIRTDQPYGHTQLHLLPHDYSRDWYEDGMEHGDITNEIEEHLKANGIMSGWVWNAAQAHFDMHWMDNDIAQPYCSQTIVTDGQWLSFFCYQLNTIAIDPDNIESNSMRNLCYGKTSVKLYEISPDGAIEVNQEALELLMKFISTGAARHRHLADDSEATEAHDLTLPVQEPDPENPALECQKPLHKVELEKELARQKEEESNSAKQLAESAQPEEEVTMPKRLLRILGSKR
uniref:28S ribosomal protein S30, mitochondrial-like n=1 Tax=Phallusia mammillata TaxID=59560 RepID=A0A6F9DKN7_9ASCI|nr:28S ribosomal protein S30, mitochondrial-like [Phallusia mammillata]